MAEPEVLEFRTHAGLPRWLVITVVALAVLALGATAVLRLRDQRQTLDQAELEAVLQGFRTEGTTRVISADDFGHGLSTDPDPCVGLLDPGADQVAGGVAWSTPDDEDFAMELDALRYPDPSAARSAMASVRAAAATCSTFRIEPRDTGDAGAEVALTAPRRHWWSDRSQERFTLRIQGADGFDFATQVRRYGNVVVWAYSPNERTDAARAATTELLGRFRAATTI